MRKKVMAMCLVCSFIFAPDIFASVVDLSVNTSGTVTAATGQVTTFERFNIRPAGTGVFEPFVRIQSSGIEKGYNTDGSPEFDTKKGKWTHALKLGNIGTIDGQLEFLLDINQSQSSTKRFLSLDAMKIYLADSGSLDDYASGLGSLIFDMGDNWVKMDNTIFGPGSGTGDMRVLIPVNPKWSADKYLYLYTEFGSNFRSSAGFEEWSTRTIPVPEPATIMLLGFGGLLFRKQK